MERRKRRKEGKVSRCGNQTRGLFDCMGNWKRTREKKHEPARECRRIGFWNEPLPCLAAQDPKLYRGRGGAFKVVPGSTTQEAALH